MGGAMIALTAVIITAVFNLAGRLSMLLPIGILIAAAILGAVDDRLSLEGRSRGGLTARFKMLWLVIFGTVAATLLHVLTTARVSGCTTSTCRSLGRFDIGLFYLPLAIFFIVGMANAST
jgi:phospho-N-acetylmuramoyl-pentapeptide-transferase